MSKRHKEVEGFLFFVSSYISPTFFASLRKNKTACFFSGYTSTPLFLKAFAFCEYRLPIRQRLSFIVRIFLPSSSFIIHLCQRATRPLYPVFSWPRLTYSAYAIYAQNFYKKCIYKVLKIWQHLRKKNMHILIYTQKHSIAKKCICLYAYKTICSKMHTLVSRSRQGI